MEHFKNLYWIGVHNLVARCRFVCFVLRNYQTEHISVQWISITFRDIIPGQWDSKQRHPPSDIPLVDLHMHFICPWGCFLQASTRFTFFKPLITLCFSITQSHYIRIDREEREKDDNGNLHTVPPILVMVWLYIGPIPTTLSCPPFHWNFYNY